MGAVANKCADVEKGAGAPKPLDADSSEDGDDDDDDEEETDEDDVDELKTEAELALQEGLKRGKTHTFKECIDHATAVGIDEDKILKAEAMLEQHKATRRREAFEAELRDFLESDKADTLEACEEMEKQGVSYGASEKAMGPLAERMRSYSNAES